MSRVALASGLAAAAGILILLAGRNSSLAANLSDDDFGHLLYLAPLAVLIGAGIFASGRNWGRSLHYLGIWALIALGLIAAYVYKSDSELSGRVLAELMPGRPVVLTGLNGENEVVIRKTKQQHFAVNADIGGKPVALLIDTGASDVVLTYEDADRLGMSFLSTLSAIRIGPHEMRLID